MYRKVKIKNEEGLQDVLKGKYLPRSPPDPQ
jgi:hypothetical protein